MTTRIVEGDLLEQNVDAIVNTVNCVGVMGKGIALQFRRKWPANFKAYEAACKAGLVQPGAMFVFDAGALLQPRYIINFPTKRHWRGPSNLGFIDEGLVDLVAQIVRLDIRSIAIPPLGCGNGGLDWDDVRPRIERALSPLRNVDARLFAPTSSNAARQLPSSSETVPMTPGRAAVVSVLAAYRTLDYPLSRIEVQKLAYFLERAGEPLGLSFVAHKYGPYSDKLRHVLTRMDGSYITGVGDQSGPSEIRVVPSALAAAAVFLEKSNAQTPERVKRVANTIDGFQTPYGMELLATVHWAAVNATPWAESFDELVARVHNWSERKRDLMSDHHIRVAAERLVEDSWLDKRVLD